MKRDPDLIRDILFAVEAPPPGQHLSEQSLVLDGFSPEVIGEHVLMLSTAGFIEARTKVIPPSLPTYVRHRSPGSLV